MSKFYQFQIDGRPAGSIRDHWKEAASDAINAGYATPAGGDHVALHGQAAIVTLSAGQAQLVLAIEMITVEVIMKAWSARFPHNAYAWPGTPREFALEAVRALLRRGSPS